MKKSAIAKSRGSQDEHDMTQPDTVLLKVLREKKKVAKNEAHYVTITAHQSHGQSCSKCKFNLGDERKCHIVRGRINNEHGISRFFSPKGDGMLPGDIVWMYVKKTGRKLKFNEGHVIDQGAPHFQCRDCKYYLFSKDCLLIDGKFKPKMSCGFIVKIGHGANF